MKATLMERSVGFHLVVLIVTKRSSPSVQLNEFIVIVEFALHRM